MKKLAALALFTLLATMSMRADVIWQETFNYSNGPVSITSTNGTGSTTVSNWITHSGILDSYVKNKRLEVSSSTAFGGVTVTRSGDVHRNFAIAPGSPYTNGQQVLYASFVVNFTNLPTANGAVFAHYSFSGTSIEGKLWGLVGNPVQTTNNFTVLPNTFRLGVSAANSGSPNKVFPIDLALNSDYQVVVGWDPVTLDAITLWVNPISSSDVSVTSGDTFTPTAANVATAFAFRQASGFGGFVTVSNLVLSTTFDEAFTNVLATNAVAPMIVYQPVGITNFVGSSIALSAVAAGQGLASLTYDWRKNGSVYSNPAGNTNVLTIGSAATTDNGNYTLIVTTPYGLSVTSSVATVLISAAPVPPSFTSQPVSQTVYRGQTATFSTTVTGPGTITYQWKSNNVDIVGETTSTLTLPNVTTNYTGSLYRVAVTNENGGIISTNATLTVSNPPVVTVAFLRSLLDPTTFATTASPTQPYQVTGTVTSYTNVTTGDTSSYYLQDATAGINIFATFGSTFRPQRGDMVTYVGVLSTFTANTGGLELFADTVNRTYTSYTIVSSGNALPAARIIPFSVTNTYGYAYVNTNLAGSLVTLTNVYFGTNAGNVLAAANTAVTVTNAGGEAFTLQFYAPDLDTVGQTLPAFASSVTGNLIGNHPNIFLAVTKFSDINTSVPVVPIPLSASFSAGIFTFNWTDASFSLQSATNVLGPWSTITGAADGFSTNITSILSDQMYFRLIHP